MRVCGLPVLSAASLSETERGAGGADTADPSSTATAAEPMRVGSAASAAGAPAQTTPSDCKLGANLSGNALGEDVSVETTRVLQLDPASTARTANAGPALPRGAGISALRHIDANDSAFNMLNKAGAAAALTPNEVVAPTSSSPIPPSPPPSPSGGDAGDSRVYLGTPSFRDLNILLLFDLSLAALCAADLTCAAAAQGGDGAPTAAMRFRIKAAACVLGRGRLPSTGCDPGRLSTRSCVTALLSRCFPGVSVGRRALSL